MAAVELVDVRKSFGRTDVLHGVSLTIAEGEFVSLLGASGCGKTTLLRTIAGLESVTSGRIRIAGQDVAELPPEKRDIAMMFQSYALLPHLTVYENVRFPLRMRRIGGRDEQHAMIRAVLDTVQLGALGDRYPRQLSGGQQQRVALARAIVSRPKVLLLDEPLSNIDARLREDMQVELIEIHRRTGLTTVFVTHDQEEALSLSDRIVLINAGRIEQAGTPEQIYARPATAFASDFIGSANVLDAVIVETPHGPAARLASGETLPLPADTVRRGPARLVIRQEDIGLGPAGGDGPAGRIVTRVYLGARTRFVVEAGGGRLRVLARDGAALAGAPGVTLRIAPGAIHILPE